MSMSAASQTPPKPVSDALLAAFAQNGALRLRCDRAFVSLLENGTPRVVAESDQSALLCGIDDQVSHKATFLDRMHSMAAFRSSTPSTHNPDNDIANQTRHIVRDVRLLTYHRSTEDYPSILAYAAVPVRSASGRLLGSFCVVDTTTRDDFLDHDTFTILNDIAGAVASYVEPQTAQPDNDHDMQAKFDLSRFLEHNRPQPTRNVELSRLSPSVSRSLTDDRHRTPLSANSTASSGHSLDQIADAYSTLDVDTPLTPPADESATSYFADSPSQPAMNGNKTSTKMDKELEHQSNVDSPAAGRHRAQQTLASAAGLIRAAHDLEGLVILNTAFSNEINSHEPPNKVRARSLLCEKLEISVVANANTPVRIASTMSVEHESLDYLISQFPQGCVLKVNERGVTALMGMGISRTGPARYEELDQAVTIPSDLQALLRAAQSLVFMPLWDSTRQAFYAGILGWPVDPMRVFTENDLLSLYIYGRILTAEVTHFDATETEATKSDFVSSLSHELRSPLHGCLAAVEVMRDTKLDKAQSDLLGMIETCASTLLYTMNHLLDFSKINNLDRAQVHGRRKSSVNAAQGSPLERFGQTSEDYLCRVVQDVVEGVAFGHDRAQAAHDKDMTGDRQNSKVRFDIEEELVITDDVAVFLFMESHAAWFSMFSAGAWKRLVMNLFGNALKFCSSGHIELTLELMPDPKTPDRKMAHLMVRDTGIGMSEEFIKHSLYRPFAQANSLISGTGLGLSIVKQIVDDMQGVINIESTLGTGSQFDVFVPVLDRESIPEGVTLDGGQVLDPNTLLRGLTLCLLTPHRAAKDSTNVSLKRTDLVQAYVKRIAENWFDMKIVYAETAEEVDADIYVVEALDHALVDRNRTILVGNQRQMAHIRTRSAHDFVELAYPLGPRALCRALHAVINKPKHQAPAVETPVPTNEPPARKTETVAASVDNPAVHQKAEPARDKPTETVIAEEPTKTQHLLLVDDNAINLKLLSTFIKKMGMDACTAVDGEDALMTYKAYAQRRPFTTILMDISMPKMNGFESTRAIRDYEIEHNLTRSRIIALTALGSEASRREAEASELDEFHMKPVSLKTLRSLFP